MQIQVEDVVRRLSMELGLALQRAVVAETAQDQLQAELDKLRAVVDGSDTQTVESEE